MKNVKPEDLPYINIEKTGKNLRKLMFESGLTARIVKETLGLTSKGPVYKWMNGKGMPNMDNLVALAYMMDITVDDIIVTD